MIVNTPPATPTARKFEKMSIHKSFEGPPDKKLYDTSNSVLIEEKEEDRRTKGGGYNESYEKSCKFIYFYYWNFFCNN